MMNCLQQLWPSSQRTRCGRAVVLAVLTAASMISASMLVLAKEHFPQQAGAVTVEGTVRNTAGEPVADAMVLLEEKGNTTIVETKSKVDGTFVLSFVHGGTYTVRAEKMGYSDTVADSLELRLGNKKHVDLVLCATNDENRIFRVLAVPQALARSHGIQGRAELHGGRCYRLEQSWLAWLRGQFENQRITCEGNSHTEIERAGRGANGQVGQAVRNSLS